MSPYRRGLIFKVDLVSKSFLKLGLSLIFGLGLILEKHGKSAIRNAYIISTA